MATPAVCIFLLVPAFGGGTRQTLMQVNGMGDARLFFTRDEQLDGVADKLRYSPTVTMNASSFTLAGLMAQMKAPPVKLIDFFLSYPEHFTQFPEVPTKTLSLLEGTS